MTFTVKRAMVLLHHWRHVAAKQHDNLWQRAVKQLSADQRAALESLRADYRGGVAADAEPVEEAPPKRRELKKSVSAASDLSGAFSCVSAASDLSGAFSPVGMDISDDDMSAAFSGCGSESEDIVMQQAKATAEEPAPPQKGAVKAMVLLKKTARALNPTASAKSASIGMMKLQLAKACSYIFFSRKLCFLET